MGNIESEERLTFFHLPQTLVVEEHFSNTEVFEPVAVEIIEIMVGVNQDGGREKSGGVNAQYRNQRREGDSAGEDMIAGFHSSNYSPKGPEGANSFCHLSILHKINSVLKHEAY